MNHLVLLGRLTRNVELRTSGNTQYAQFSMAVDRNRNNGVDFINCVCFGKVAETLAKYCEKGRQILLDGRLSVSSNKGRNYYSAIATQITFLQRPRRSQNNAAPTGNDRTDEKRPF